MTIHDFHSKLSSRNEDNVLFEALHRLRRLENFRVLLFIEEEAAGGWYPWNDANGYPQPVHAEA
jgi:hypothetical protein